MSASQATPKECWDILTEVAERNGPVDVARLATGSNDPGPFHRVRLLECSSVGLVIEQPSGPGVPNGMPLHSRMQMTVCAGGRRWQLVTSVVRVIDFALNEQCSLSAAVLSPPSECREAQRRQFFRVDTLGLGIESAILYPARDGHRFQGVMPIPCVMLDFSAGGLGLSAPSDVNSLRRFSEFVCEFTMPDRPTPFCITAELVNIQERDATTVKLGLRFLIPHNSAGRRLDDRLYKWAVELQRRQIQRRRGDLKE